MLRRVYISIGGCTVVANAVGDFLIIRSKLRRSKLGISQLNILVNLWCRELRQAEHHTILVAWHASWSLILAKGTLSPRNAMLTEQSTVTVIICRRELIIAIDFSHCGVNCLIHLTKFIM